MRGVVTPVMTRRQSEVSWNAPAPGAYTRQLRFGEWISEPVTPLFESWLLTSDGEPPARSNSRRGSARSLHGRTTSSSTAGTSTRSTAHPRAAPCCAASPGMLAHLRDPAPGRRRSSRRPFGTAFPLVRAEVARGPAAALPRGGRGRRRPVEITAGRRAPGADRRAGRSRRRVLRLDRGAGGRGIQDGDEPRPVLQTPPRAGHSAAATCRCWRVSTSPAGPEARASSSLDWWHPALPPGRRSRDRRTDHSRVVDARQAAEAAAFEALASSPRRLRAFRRLLAETQHLVPIREEQTRELTIAWPVMRRAVAPDRRGARGRGVIADPDDVFFLTRAEAARGARGGAAAADASTCRRRRRAERAGSPRATALVGRVNPMIRRRLGQLPGADRRPSLGPGARRRARRPRRAVRPASFG